MSTAQSALGIYASGFFSFRRQGNRFTWRPGRDLHYRQCADRPSFEVVPNNLEGIASRSFAVMNRVGAQAVLVQTSKAAAREGMKFHLTYIDKNVPEKGTTGFEPRRCAVSTNTDIKKRSVGRSGRRECRRSRSRGMLR